MCINFVLGRNIESGEVTLDKSMKLNSCLVQKKRKRSVTVWSIETTVDEEEGGDEEVVEAM